MAKQIGGFDVTPPKGSFAARVARANNVDAGIDESELTDAERVSLRKADSIDKAVENFKFVPAEQALERVEIIFDNSGSMGVAKMEDAKEGVTEFMKACTPNETAIRVTPVDTGYGDDSQSGVIKFTTNLPMIATEIKKFRSMGGTPLYSKLKQALNKDGRRNDIYPSRIIAFSDGQAGDGNSFIPKVNEWSCERPATESHIEVVKLAKITGVCIDTCLIADDINTETVKQSSEYFTMKALAEETGGVFILFEKSKCDFKRGFKYLTKGNRLLLTDSAFKAKLEEGQI